MAATSNNKTQVKQKRINLLGKSGLARLLAFENLAVIHDPSAKTASFDLGKRVVRLPILKEMQGFMYDAFIAHEIAHALFTPPKGWEEVQKKLPASFVNVTEDARIEKLIQRRYPGTRKDFYQFYRDLASPERDFFGLKKLPKNPITNKPISLGMLGLIDKINLHFKIGSVVKIPFTDEEKPLVKQTGDAETWDEAVEAAQAIYDFMKKKGQLTEVKIKIGMCSSSSGQGEGKEEQQQQNNDNNSKGNSKSKQQKKPKNGDNKEDEKQEANSSGKKGSKDKDGESEDEKQSNGDKDKSDESKVQSDENQDGSDGAKNDGDENSGGDSSDNGDKESSGSGSDENDDEGSQEGDGTGESDSGDGKDGNDNDSDSGNSQQAGSGKDGDQDDDGIVLSLPTGLTQENFDQTMADSFFDKTATKGTSFGDVYDASQVYKHSVIPVEKVASRMKAYGNRVPDPVAESEYTEFMKRINPTINMMVAHFNMRKSAQDYQRLQIAKTGELDMDQISQYSTQDDIFRRNEMVPETKNHGMVMIIDWSGSMSSNIHSTLKQLVILMEFNRKVGIPFEVYGFTCRSGYAPSATITPSNIYAQQGAELFQLFSSTMRDKEFKAMCSQALALTSRGRADGIHGMSMTPLTHAAFLSEYVLADFKARYKNEKTIFVLLSDGGPTDRLVCGNEYAKEHVIMRNPVTGFNYQFENGSGQYPFHDIFKYVKDRVGITKMIGFYLGNMDQGTAQCLNPNPKRPINVPEHVREFKAKNYTALADGVAFNKFFVVSINNFQIDETDYMENISTHSSANAVSKALANQLTKGINSMLFMRLFIEEIS